MGKAAWLEPIETRKIRFSKRAAASFAKSGVPYGQAGVLKFLNSRRGQDTSNRQIEEHFGISNPAASGLVKRLVERGLAVSQVDQFDRRFRNVRITRSGVEAASRVQESIMDLSGQMLSGFTAQEKAEAVRLLRKMYDNLS